MNFLKYIGAGSIVLMIVIGFFTFLVADNFWKEKSWYMTYKNWAKKALIGLTALTFLAWGSFMVYLLFDK